MKRVIVLLLAISLAVPVNAGWRFWKKGPPFLPRETHWGERAGFIVIIVLLVVSNVYFLIKKNDVRLELNQKKKDSTAKKNRIRELEGEAAQKTEMIDTLPNQIDRLNGTVTELTSKLQEKTIENEELTGQLRSKEHDSSMKTGELERNVEEISELKIDLTKAESTLKDTFIKFKYENGQMVRRIHAELVKLDQKVVLLSKQHEEEIDELLKVYCAEEDNLRNRLAVLEDHLPPEDDKQ